MKHRVRPLALACCMVWACSRTAPVPVVLGSTTSTEDSGLFEALIPAFEREHPRYRVRVVAVGSGEALAMGARGDADVLLVHSPAAEDAFMRGGHGVTRRRVMYNDFLILGDSSDPAAVRMSRSATDAFGRIAGAQARFVSRGDQSGTHAKELSLWGAAGLDSGKVATEKWHLAVGQGMGETLRMADEMSGYTLSDRGTYLSMRERLRLEVVFEGDPQLRNVYSVIVPARSKQADGAEAFARWITSANGQDRIRDFGRERFGLPLFTPDAGPGGP